MDKVYDICCGIDVHKKLIVACLRKGNRHEIREFGATTRELLEMADWLSLTFFSTVSLNPATSLIRISVS